LSSLSSPRADLDKSAYLDDSPTLTTRRRFLAGDIFRPAFQDKNRPPKAAEK
jgi:hypothetical protein